MSRVKLPQQSSDLKSRKAAPSRSGVDLHAGPGNRELLAQLGRAGSLSQSAQGGMERAAGADLSGTRLQESPLAAQHDAQAMRAFDAVSGGELSPMSAGPAPVSPAGPVQAKKKRDMTAGERFTEGYHDLDLPDQVTALRNMSVTASFDPNMDDTEFDAFYDLAAQADESFIQELVRQMIDAAKDLNEQKRLYSAGGSEMDIARGEYMAKHSMESTMYKGYGDLIQNMGLAGNEAGAAYLQEQLRILRETSPDDFEQLDAATRILNSDEGTNIWVRSERDAQASAGDPEGWSLPDQLRDLDLANSTSFAKNWRRPEKQGFFQRIFGRRRRSGHKWTSWA